MNVVFAERVKSRCRGQGIWTDILVVLFPLSFCLKKKAPKKSRHKGDCAAIRFAPIRRSFPLMYPPLDCSADSAMTSHRPKCSAGTTPRISYRENARLLPQFFALAERAAMPIYCFSFSCSPSVYRRKSRTTAKSSHC